MCYNVKHPEIIINCDTVYYREATWKTLDTSQNRDRAQRFSLISGEWNGVNAIFKRCHEDTLIAKITMPNGNTMELAEFKNKYKFNYK